MTRQNNQPDENRASRRELLAGVAAGATAGAAGCLTTMPSLGQQIRFGRVDEPRGTSPVYREWVPDKRPESADNWPRSALYTTPGQLGADVVGRPYTVGQSVVQAGMDYVGIDLETMAYAGATSDVTFTVGDINLDAVEEAVARTGYEPDGQLRGMAVYSRSDTGRTIAVDDKHILSGAGDNAQALIERVDEAKRGHSPRAYDSSREFQRFVDQIRASPYVHIFSGLGSDGQIELPPSSYSTIEFRYDEEYVYFLARALYEDEAEIDQRTVEREIHENDRAFEAHNVDVRVHGNVAGWVIQMTHSEYHDSASGPADFVEPHITWGVNDEGDEITLTHEAGDSIDASLLEVQVNSSGNREPTDQQFSDAYNTVRPGDSRTIDADTVGPQDTLTIWGSVPDSPNGWAELHYNRD